MSLTNSVTMHQPNGTDPFKDPKDSRASTSSRRESGIRLAAAAAASTAAHDTAVANGAGDFVLAVGHDVSLTLGTESLIILDERRARLRGQKCCGLTLPHKSTPTRLVPYFNVLWVECSKSELTITHAASKKGSHVRVEHIAYPLDKINGTEALKFCTRLLDLAYGASQRNKRVKVLINPFGGQGTATKLWTRDMSPILTAARCILDIETTTYSGHASKIAEDLDIEQYDVIACVSGDGLPHEVFNGLGRRKDAARALRKIAVTQLPAGSGNALSININRTNNPSLSALSAVKGLRMPMDLMSITQGEQRLLSFLTQSFGIIAESDLGTEHMRWMGEARFVVGFLTRLFLGTTYPCDIAIKSVDDDKTSIRTKYREHLSQSRTASQSEPRPAKGQSSEGNGEGLPPLRFGKVSDPLPDGWELRPFDTIGNFFNGNMPFVAKDMNFFQAALADDGLADLILMDGKIPRLAALQLLLASSNTDSGLFDLPLVTYRKIEAFRLIPRGTTGCISIDGERLPYGPFQAEVHRGLGTVLSRSGRGYEAPVLSAAAK